MATDRRLDVPTLTKITRELFRSSRRTVSFLDLVEAYGRRFDATFTARVVALLPEVAEELEVQGVPCVLVNEFCLGHFAEVAVLDVAEARRCNVFNSGGKVPVGIRHALPDDLVRAEVNGSLSHLGSGAVEVAVQRSVNDVAGGITPPDSHDRLVSRLRDKLPRITEAKPTPRQQPLLPSDDDDEDKD